MTRPRFVILASLLLGLHVSATARAQVTGDNVFDGRVTSGTVWALLLTPDDGGETLSIPVGEDGRFRQQIVNPTRHYLLATDPPCTPLAIELSENANGVLNLVRSGRPDEIIDATNPGISNIETVKTGFSFSYSPGGGVSFSMPITRQSMTFDNPASRITTASLGFGGSSRLSLSANRAFGGVRMTTGVCDVEP